MIPSCSELLFTSVVSFSTFTAYASLAPERAYEQKSTGPGKRAARRSLTLD